MGIVYLGIFLPQKSIDQLLVPIDTNIKHPHITMKYYGTWNLDRLSEEDHSKVGIHTEIHPWAMITSKDIDVLICRRSHEGMGDMPHVTLRASNGALPVNSNKYTEAYTKIFKARVFDSSPLGDAQYEALDFFAKEHPDAKIFKYGTISPIAARWGVYTSEGVKYQLPPKRLPGPDTISIHHPDNWRCIEPEYDAYD
jgi:hypothetical protein